MPLTKITADTLNDGAVTTAKIVDANVTPAKLSQPMTQGAAQATTSGTTKDFTGIPSWAKRITIVFSGVSTSGTSLLQVQIGSGSFTTSGYSSVATVTSTTANTSSGATATSGFHIQGASAASTLFGKMELLNVSGNTWVASHTLGNVGFTLTANGGGGITLAGVLDRVRVTTVNGTDTFDAGSVNILYEG